jgi:class 3 adenylate cyclase
MVTLLFTDIEDSIRLWGGIGLRDLGEHRLKDLGRAERVFQVTGPGLAEGFGPLLSLENPVRSPSWPTP